MHDPMTLAWIFRLPIIGKVVQQLKRWLFSRCGFCCRRFIVPKRQGVGDEASNLQGLCKSCHSRKTLGEVVA